MPVELRPLAGGLVSSALKQRHQEGRGLAGAGLGLAGDVLAREREGQGLAWMGVAGTKPASLMPRATAGTRSSEANASSERCVSVI